MTPAVALDSHLALALADALRRAGIGVVHISHWEDLRSASDEKILATCASVGRVFITLDASTVPALANGWIREGRHHAGVILLSKRIGRHDIGGMLEAILHELHRTDIEPFADLVRHAQRPR